MILRFEVNQAEAFRQGVNVEKSTNHIDVDPSELSQEDRNLIADRLKGIDVMRLEVTSDAVDYSTGERKNARVQQNPGTRVLDNTKGRIVANLPTFESLMIAVRENQAEVEEALKAAGRGRSVGPDALNGKRV